MSQTPEERAAEAAVKAAAAELAAQKRDEELAEKIRKQDEEIANRLARGEG